MGYSFVGVVIVIIITASLLLQPSTSQTFDPYQLNGGLVAAVAGKDYVLIASDTRLTDGGYGIKSRNYLSGRIWSAHSTFTSASMASPSTSSFTTSPIQLENDENYDGDTSPFTLRRISTDTLWSSDGSLIVSSNNNVVNDRSSETTTLAQKQIMDMDKINSYTTHIKSNRIQSNTLPIMIGSAGCASDCEALKRRMRLELDALLSSSYSSGIEVQSVANLLQQILYGRRTFPFYSFCVVAGIDTRGVVRGGEKGGVGAVYVYDAIGSYERVAVACAGTGRELLQPVLDRVFTSSQQRPRRRRKCFGGELSSVEDGAIDEVDEEVEEEHESITTIPAAKQQVGIAGSLRPPVITHVSCPWEEAVRNIAHAYMSVAEREISVGDEVVICVVHASSEIKLGSGNEDVVNVFRYPLKKH
ncbi:hypothetical protein ACHAWU_000425 [Discostella pseudostelligera]|uniref:Uncharacterized protein n=1 Tax=Discostella pseudostelligera TaxID=259834 RepID=A0ABD3M4Y1_9STRA